MNLIQNYDTVEGKDGAGPRAIAMGDVLEHEGGDRYLVFAYKGPLILGNLRNGTHYGDGARVHDIDRLTREEASFLCAGNLEFFRLIGRAKDVLTVQDLGD